MGDQHTLSLSLVVHKLMNCKLLLAEARARRVFAVFSRTSGWRRLTAGVWSLAVG